MMSVHVFDQLLVKLVVVGDDPDCIKDIHVSFTNDICVLPSILHLIHQLIYLFICEAHDFRFIGPVRQSHLSQISHGSSSFCVEHFENSISCFLWSAAILCNLKKSVIVLLSSLWKS